MDLTKVVITTDRLKLVPTSRKYATEIFNEFTDEISIYMFPKPAAQMDETLHFIDSAVKGMLSGLELSVAILDKETNEFLGHAGASKLNSNRPELGIWIKKKAHGHRYGREAVKGLRDWIDENITYQYIKYPVDKRNIPSRKIAEYLGGVIEDEYKKINLAGNVLDEAEYRIYPKDSS